MGNVKGSLAHLVGSYYYMCPSSRAQFSTKYFYPTEFNAKAETNIRLGRFKDFFFLLSLISSLQNPFLSTFPLTLVQLGMGTWLFQSVNISNALALYRQYIIIILLLGQHLLTFYPNKYWETWTSKYWCVRGLDWFLVLWWVCSYPQVALASRWSLWVDVVLLLKSGETLISHELLKNTLLGPNSDAPFHSPSHYHPASSSQSNKTLVIVADQGFIGWRNWLTKWLSYELPGWLYWVGYLCRCRQLWRAIWDLKLISKEDERQPRVNDRNIATALPTYHSCRYTEIHCKIPGKKITYLWIWLRIIWTAWRHASMLCLRILRIFSLISGPSLDCPMWISKSLRIATCVLTSAIAYNKNSELLKVSDIDTSSIVYLTDLISAPLFYSNSFLYCSSLSKVHLAHSHSIWI